MALVSIALRTDGLEERGIPECGSRRRARVASTIVDISQRPESQRFPYRILRIDPIAMGTGPGRLWQVHPRSHPRTFQIYCHEDSRCTLKVDQQERLLEFEDVTEAIRAVVDLNEIKGEATLTVFNAVGKVVFQAVV